jgi:hypothetical protein
MSAVAHPVHVDQRAKLHRELMAFNHRRLTPTVDTSSWPLDLVDENEWRLEEGRFVERERAKLVLDDVPLEPATFVEWFTRLRDVGPGQNDPLFPWLATKATRAEMTWFITQEVAGEAGFDDLVAMSQVKLPAEAKLEMARNYWDEMGQGHAGGMHGPMLERLVHELAIEHDLDGVVWESLALGNLMTALASNRRYAYQSIGALGVIELTAPGRASLVNAGLKRLGIGGEARRYFALHATLDVKHSLAWNANVLAPLVASDPRIARPLAEGALMRLAAGERCFQRYRRELGI